MFNIILSSVVIIMIISMLSLSLFSLFSYKVWAFFDLNTLSVCFQEPVSFPWVWLITRTGAIIQEKCAVEAKPAKIERPRYREAKNPLCMCGYTILSKNIFTGVSWYAQ